jgi:LysM repeat protein
MRTAKRAILTMLVTLLLLLTTTGAVLADSQSYVVQPGDTIFKISVRFGISMDALRAANGIVGDRIYAGQTLIIPDPNAPPANNPPPADPAAQVIHVVQSGETLFTIGLRYGMTWTKIQAANGLAGTTVYVGQRLIIPVSGSTQNPAPAPTQPPVNNPTPVPPPADNGGQIIHIVQAGETLHKIGLKYGVSWPAIQRANNLPNDRIYTGQRLVIPTGDAANPLPVNNPPPPPGEHLGGKRFLVDLSDQMLYAYEGDALVRSTLVSTGTWRTPTVTGTYYIYARYASARMRGPGYDLPNVPFTQYFYKGYGLHGTYWHSNFGTPMSHGCVNLPTPEAEWAFNWATFGTPVIVQP